MYRGHAMRRTVQRGRNKKKSSIEVRDTGKEKRKYIGVTRCDTIECSDEHGVTRGPEDFLPNHHNIGEHGSITVLYRATGYDSQP